MKRIAIVALLSVAAWTTTASADTANGTLTVTGTVGSAITLTVESAGGTTTGLGTSAATSALGTVTKYGAAPTGFTITRDTSDWTLTSAVGVKVAKANLASPTFSLTAALANAPATGTTWKLNGTALTVTSAPMTIAGTYGTTQTYGWDIVVNDAMTTAAIDNQIAFVATSN